MSEQYNERDMIAAIARDTELDEARIAVVLKYEQAFINNAPGDANGNVEIDHDELVEYIMRHKDVGLNELQVEQVLDAEMEFLTDIGLVGYED